MLPPTVVGIVISGCPAVRPSVRPVSVVRYFALHDISVLSGGI